MHQSSFSIMTQFRNLVIKHFPSGKIKILDVGSYGVNGTYKEIFSDKDKFSYTGLDLQPGPNVDYVPEDPYLWHGLEDESFEVIVSGQAFEHMEFPWLIIEEMRRKLRNDGLVCIVAPSRGPEHKYPVDCWRYYPDGFRALAKWAGLEVLEAKACWGASGFSDGSDQWGDTFCILYKAKAGTNRGTGRHIVNKNNPLRLDKRASYYSIARTEIIEAVVKNSIPAKKVLEIGCSGGATGKGLKEAVKVDYYVGVEVSEQAAKVAGRWLDKVIVADIENTDLAEHGLKTGDFDLVLVLDVLEHLYDPWDALASLAKYLRPGGSVVASVPNVQNIMVLKDLIKGRWKYEDAGILDATHLRFFTRDGIAAMFEGAGLSVTGMDSVLNPVIDLSAVKDSDNILMHDNLSLKSLSREDVLQLYTYQYLVVARKGASAAVINELHGSAEGLVPAPEVFSSGQSAAGAGLTGQFQSATKQRTRDLVSIIILTFNQLEFTKKCIRSIRKHTAELHEIIFVDNGSTDGTVKWLKKLVKENANYNLIENKTNLGFSKGCNQGIEASSGEYILLLNNDVVITANWLSGMLDCLNSSPDTGIVGPMTNNISGPQQVMTADYRSLDFLDEYAGLFRQNNRYRRIPLRRIVGFCMLFRHELVEKIGMLDESFGTGNFEDDDFSLRAALQGCVNMVAGDVFIHHYGSASFKGNNIEYSSSIGKNKKVFDEKWRNIDVSSSLGKKLAVLNDLELAWEFYQRQQVDQAITTLIDGIKYSPDDKEIYYRLTEILLDSKLFSDATDALNSMPEELKKEAKWHALAACCNEGMERSDKAAEHADVALSQDPGCALAINLKGMLAYKRGDSNTAEDYFREAVGANPAYGEPYTNLGVLKWAAGGKEEALNTLEKGFVLAPTNADSITLYHSAITATGEFERAEKIFREAQAFYPLHKRLQYLLIDTLLKQGKNEIAMLETEQALISFGTDDGLLAAALEIRNGISFPEVDASGKSGTLSVCMIVRDEEQHLARCLMSAQPVADEVIVVDTGSTDRTRDIARVFGAKVFEQPWTGDFSESRNYSLEKASGEWVLVMDADEVISPRDYDALRAIVKDKGRKTVAYEITTRNYVSNISVLGWGANKGQYPLEETGTGWFPSAKVRLFPRRDGIRFEGKVHETLEASILAAGMKVLACGIVVHHYGKMNREKVLEKGEHYYLLGRRKLEETGGDVKAIFELATQAQELNRYEEAAELWRRAIDLSGERPSAVLFFNMGYAQLQLEHYDQALLSSAKALDIDPGMKEAALNWAYCELLVGDCRKVIGLFERMLPDGMEYPPALLLLAAAYGIAGDRDKAEAAAGQLRGKGFLIADALNLLAGRLIRQGRADHALAVSEIVSACGYDNAETGEIQDARRERPGVSEKVTAGIRT